MGWLWNLMGKPHYDDDASLNIMVSSTLWNSIVGNFGSVAPNKGAHPEPTAIVITLIMSDFIYSGLFNAIIKFVDVARVPTVLSSFPQRSKGERKEFTTHVWQYS